MSEEKPKVTTSRTFNIQAGTEAKQLVSANPKRVGLLVYNNGSVTVYILSAQNMAVGDGIPVAAGATYSNDESTNEYYIITESSTADVRVEVISA